MPIHKPGSRAGLALLLALISAVTFADTRQWSVSKVNAWYAKQGWLVGSNYVPADAINQLEMWQAETWNPARGVGSTFDTSLPIAVKYNVGMINWGFVVGKTQTQYPWDSWQKPYTATPPAVWHHDIFHADGKPYRQAEVDQIRALTSAVNRKK